MSFGLPDVSNSLAFPDSDLFRHFLPLSRRRKLLLAWIIKKNVFLKWLTFSNKYPPVLRRFLEGRYFRRYQYIPLKSSLPYHFKVYNDSSPKKIFEEI